MLNQFLEFLESVGCKPFNVNEIKADNCVNRYRLDDDKPNKRNASYQISFDGQFGYGWVRNHKEGVTHAWFSRSPRQLSEEERILFQVKKKNAKAKAEQELLNRQKKAAERAEFIWARAVAGKSHEYSTRKKIGLGVARLHHGLIVLPVYRDWQLRTLQFIACDGQKRFLRGGEKQGSWLALGEFGETVWLVEGWATGESVRQAVGDSVVVCFDAGNLLPVARSIRQKFPKARIVIAGDNDAAGIKGAQVAADLVGGEVMLPSGHKDWNDLHCAEGIEAVKAALMGTLAVSSERIAPSVQSGGGNPSWQAQLIYTRTMQPVHNSLHNTILFLQNHPEFCGRFRFDQFASKIVVFGDDVHALTDLDITKAAAAIERFGLSPDTNRVHKAIVAAAHENAFHPARDYFDSLVWDGTERLKTWLTYYLGAEREPEDYLAFIGTKWMVAAVTRIYVPGHKFDHVLVLEGQQGKGKSKALRTLATFGRDKPMDYFTDGVRISDLSNKDTIQKMQGKIIVELAELAGFNKKEDEEIKSWITTQEDDARMPYERTNTKFPRQFVLAATTNNSEYLKDPTGNRRYWPFTTGQLDFDALEKDREQLWAEAVFLYKKGTYIGPTEDEMRLAEIEQEKRRSIDIWESDVMRLVNDKWKQIENQRKVGEQTMFIRLENILSDLGLDVTKRQNREARRITSILQANGFKRASTWFNNETIRHWER